MNKSAVDFLRAHWLSKNSLSLNKGVSIALIENFEKSWNVKLPVDFCDYLMYANGFEVHVGMDKMGCLETEAFYFLPLSGDNLISSKYLVFCEWPYALVQYALCVDDSGMNGSVVYVRDESRGGLLASSFSGFVSLYMANAPLLHNGGSEIVMLK